MTSELDVLRIVSDRLARLGIPFMLTGSYAMAYYATPRMTRDLDLVVALEAARIDDLLSAFSADFYVDADAVREAVRTVRLFNLMHLESGIKVDMILKKSAPYRDVEFDRRQSVELSGIRAWLVSREDLIMSLESVGSPAVVNDTSPEFSRIVADRHAAMTPEERLRAASDMFDTARSIVESSLPAGLSSRERRLALLQRLYGNELPQAAQEAFARFEEK